MILLANSYLAGGIGFVVGALLVFFFLRWREQTLRKAQALEAQSIVDAARRASVSVACLRRDENDCSVSWRSRSASSLAFNRASRRRPSASRFAQSMTD